MKQEYLSSVFALAHTDIRPMPFNNHSRTIRLVVPCNRKGNGVSMRFANHYGAGPLDIGAVTIALCDENGSLRKDTLAPVTVKGKLAFELEPGELLQSDRVDFAVNQGDYFAVSIYYPAPERVVSGNHVGNTVHRSRPGNFTATDAIQGPGLVNRFARTMVSTDVTVYTTTIFDVVLHCDKPGRVLACFGDSITQQNNWTGPLQKLLHAKYPGEISLCNLGISGNRLLWGSPPAQGGHFGEAGIQRFDRDITRLHGLTHAILEIGTNDLGHPGSMGVPESELITLPQYADAMADLARRLHDKNVKVIAATLAPRVIDPPYDHAREHLRKEINVWIRSAECFDAVLDLDQILRRDDGEPGMKEDYALIDGLHPSPIGGMMIAKAIDLGLFGGEGDA